MVTASPSASPTGCPKLWTFPPDDSEQQPRADVLFNDHPNAKDTWIYKGRDVYTFKTRRSIFLHRIRRARLRLIYAPLCFQDPLLLSFVSIW